MQVECNYTVLLNSLTGCVEIQLHESQDNEWSHEKHLQSVKVWAAPMMQHVPVVTEAACVVPYWVLAVLLLCFRAGVRHGESAPHPADRRHTPSHHHHRHEIPVLLPQPVSRLFVYSEIHRKEKTDIYIYVTWNETEELLNTFKRTACFKLCLTAK